MNVATEAYNALMERANDLWAAKANNLTSDINEQGVLAVFGKKLIMLECLLQTSIKANKVLLDVLTNQQSEQIHRQIADELNKISDS